MSCLFCFSLRSILFLSFLSGCRLANLFWRLDGLCNSLYLVRLVRSVLLDSDLVLHDFFLQFMNGNILGSRFCHHNSVWTLLTLVVSFSRVIVVKASCTRRWFSFERNEFIEFSFDWPFIFRLILPIRRLLILYNSHRLMNFRSFCLWNCRCFWLNLPLIFPIS